MFSHLVNLKYNIRFLEQNVGQAKVVTDLVVFIKEEDENTFHKQDE